MIAALQLPFQSQSLHHSFFTSLIPYFVFPSHLHSTRLPSSPLCERPLPQPGEGVSGSVRRALSPLESARPKNPSVTPLQSRLPKTQHLNSFRIRTYKKAPGGRGPITTRHAFSARPRERRLCRPGRGVSALSFFFPTPTHDSRPTSSHPSLPLPRLSVIVTAAGRKRSCL